MREGRDGEGRGETLVRWGWDGEVLVKAKGGYIYRLVKVGSEGKIENGEEFLPEQRYLIGYCRFEYLAQPHPIELLKKGYDNASPQPLGSPKCIYVPRRGVGDDMDRQTNTLQSPLLAMTTVGSVYSPQRERLISANLPNAPRSKDDAAPKARS